MADDPEFLARCDGRLALGQRRRDPAEMAVDADETVVLHHHFETARAFALDADDVPGGRSRYRARAGAGISTP